MFKKKYVLRAATLVVSISAVAFGLSCSNDVTTSPNANYSRTNAIEGTVYLMNTQTPISGVDVTWYCDEHDPVVELGSDTTGGDGSYTIPHTWGTTHDGHDMYGTAVKFGYTYDINKIYDFDSGSIPYTRDFRLFPSP